ncbi:MAG: carbohydrate ABC transporter permease [Acutalibacteraceae bacterium]|nr:carbohydrate ABC transporter permease [Acutalibacteraceae bacterium]
MAKTKVAGQVDVDKLKASKKVFNPGPGRSRWGNILNFLFICLVGVFMLFPLLYIINNAFKPLDELFMFPPNFFVRNPTFDNFTNISVLMSESWIPFSRYVFNTLFITAVATFFHIVLASLAAYVLEKRDFPGAKPIFKVMEISLLFTTTATAIPSYIIMSYLGMIDTSWALIVPYVGSTMGLYLMKQHLSSTVPNALLEAARIDGASELRIFASIVMPLAKPAWLTMMMFAVQSMWTQQGASQIFSEAKKPLTYALNQIVTGGVARAGAGAAVQLILITPPILMFVLIQSQVLDTMASSGMKD